jgi:hypothetical protein
MHSRVVHDVPIRCADYLSQRTTLSAGERQHDRLAVANLRKHCTHGNRGSRISPHRLEQDLRLDVRCIMMTIGRSNKALSDTRNSVSWSLERAPNSGTNCLGEARTKPARAASPRRHRLSNGALNLVAAAKRCAGSLGRAES